MSKQTRFLFSAYTVILIRKYISSEVYIQSEKNDHCSEVEKRGF